MSTGGSIESVTLAGRTFSVAADADGERELGGFSNEVSPNGDETARLLKTRMSWILGGLTLAMDDLGGDPEFLQSLRDINGFFPVSVTFASGAIYQGTGQITGDTPTATATATAAVALSGPRRLTKQ